MARNAPSGSNRQRSIATLKAYARLSCTALLLILAVHPAVQAQDARTRIIHTRQSEFRIPFETDATERRLREVRLFVSDDQGRTWRKYDTVAPEDAGFKFRAENDGLYWFTVQTVDADNRLSPPAVQGARPQLRIQVDTSPPVVTLQSRPTRDGVAGVEWDIRDEGVDLSTLLLEYRNPGVADWIPLVLPEPAATGERLWTPGTNGAVEVRLRVRDYAKNEGEARLTVSPGGQEIRTSRNSSETGGARSANRSAPGARFVNSKRFSLNYEIKEAGPSGVAGVELWATRDGRNWEKFKEDTSEKSPLMIDVQEEGIYGFILLVKSGVGLMDRPPRTGDAPQVWVEVDLTKPVVHWVNAEAGNDSGKITVTWKATDKANNLARESITLSYAKDAKGPWTPFATNIENSGRFEWRATPGVPYKFHVRVEAADKAGNVGAAETLQPVIIDLARPKGVIVGVESAGKASPEPNP